MVNFVAGALQSNTLASPKNTKKNSGKGKTRLLQEAFAEHLRHVGRVYPQDQYPSVVRLIDNARWHRGGRSARRCWRTHTCDCIAC